MYIYIYITYTYIYIYIYTYIIYIYIYIYMCTAGVRGCTTTIAWRLRSGCWVSRRGQGERKVAREGTLRGTGFLDAVGFYNTLQLREANPRSSSAPTLVVGGDSPAANPTVVEYTRAPCGPMAKADAGSG